MALSGNKIFSGFPRQDPGVSGTAKARVLYIGADYPGSNSTSLRNAILRHGHECLTVPMWEPNLTLRLDNRYGLLKRERAQSQHVWNRRLTEIADEWGPDLVVVFRGLSVMRETISHFSTITVHYHPDDSSSPYNRSRIYDDAESAYDLHVTTKSFNPPELASRGVKRSLYVRCAYDRDWHVPPRRASPRYVVGFIGSRRPDRTTLIRDVAARWGKGFHLAGGKWQRDPRLRRIASVSGPVMGINFSLAVASAPVQIGLLNRYNRDLHTCRSYEVPAAGGVLLGERTAEHVEMLDEGSEALFFSSDDELFEHIEFLRTRPELVGTMGKRASDRVRRDCSSYEDRWTQISQELGLA